MLVVGLNAYHGDAAACILRDGEIIAAAEEERFRRVKHWAGFPAKAFEYCLAEAGANLSDVDAVAINSDPRANLRKRLFHALARRPSASMILDRIANHRRRLSITEEIERNFPGQKFRGVVHRIEHHRAHLASTFLVSPFSRAVVLSLDGFGDFASAAWGVGDENDLRIDHRIDFPHSLGIFYQAITQHLGFPHYGDEYKVMGLAPYGEAKYIREMRHMVRLESNGGYSLNLKYFRHHREKVDVTWNEGAPRVGILYSELLTDLLGPPRGGGSPLDQRLHDIARSAQEMYEEAFFHLLNNLRDRYGETRIALAGGCAMNSVANGKISRRSGFREVYVAAAAGDAGGAIGAALELARQMDGFKRRRMTSAYLGPSYSNTEISAKLADQMEELEARGCVIETVHDDVALCKIIAQKISDGKVVGWFQGRMELGSRALGNRSILGDPRRRDMKEILNSKIKRREAFRPFAPSILSERVGEWFEETADVPFMTQVFQIREEQQIFIPAVTHVDGSGRLQTVSENDNPRYHRLIAAFEQLTGVPILLNTSFNENEPIVCRPLEALECFLRTDMDVLVLGDTIISRVPLMAIE